MPNTPISPEASAVQDAYADQLKLLFSHLCTNMESLPDAQSFANFTNGFNIATRAKTFALSVVPTKLITVSMTIPATKRQRK